MRGESRGTSVREGKRRQPVGRGAGRPVASVLDKTGAKNIGVLEVALGRDLLEIAELKELLLRHAIADLRHHLLGVALHLVRIHAETDAHGGADGLAILVRLAPAEEDLAQPLEAG